MGGLRTLASRNFSYTIGQIASGDVARGFARDGVVVIKDAVDPVKREAFTNAIRTLLQRRLTSLGIRQVGEDLDALYRDLVSAGPHHVGELFVVVRHLVEHTELIFAPVMLKIAHALIGDTILQVIPESCGIRIDPPQDTVRAFGWHHDYSYLSMSLNGITGWVPLVPMTTEMGFMRVVPGSHLTITPVVFREDLARAGNFMGHRTFELKADFEMLEVDSIDMRVRPNDMLFIHCLTLHRSGVNISDRSRWTCLPRYGDALDEQVVSRGWSAIRGKDSIRLFNELHPELVEVRNSS